MTRTFDSIEREQDNDGWHCRVTMMVLVVCLSWISSSHSRSDTCLRLSGILFEQSMDCKWSLGSSYSALACHSRGERNQDGELMIVSFLDRWNDLWFSSSYQCRPIHCFSSYSKSIRRWSERQFGVNLFSSQATGSHDQTICLYDLDQTSSVKPSSLRGHFNNIRALAFSHASYLVSSSSSPPCSSRTVSLFPGISWMGQEHHHLAHRYPSCS